MGCRREAFSTALYQVASGHGRAYCRFPSGPQDGTCTTAIPNPALEIFQVLKYLYSQKDCLKKSSVCTTVSPTSVFQTIFLLPFGTLAICWNARLLNGFCITFGFNF